MNNLRFALRQLRKAPAFTVTALAICLGANLATFARDRESFISLGVSTLTNQ